MQIFIQIGLKLVEILAFQHRQGMDGWMASCGGYVASCGGYVASCGGYVMVKSDNKAHYGL